MEEVKLEVMVEVTEKDGRFYFNILADTHIDRNMIRSILAGGLALTIRGEETPQEQGLALRDVINYLENEFINTDSFSDAYIRNDERK